MTGISNWTLARRSVAFYLRSHLGTIFGAAIATAVLTGALLVGDSVRGSLRAMALARLGKIDTALASGDRLFRSALAQDLKRELGGEVVAALQVLGSASIPDSSARANQVQVIGVQESFWKLANKSLPAHAGDAVFVNDRLAAQLKLRPGDTILLRLPRVSQLSRDAPLAAEEDATAALRLEVGRILGDEEFGRFGLAASQLPPLNAFVPLAVLQRSVNATNQANLLLISGASEAQAQAALAKAIQVQDMQLQIRDITNPPSLELRSPRVFLDAVVSEVALKAEKNPQPIFTYFVNQLRHDQRTTPYSMVSGTTMLPLGDNEIALNQWLADDLQAKPGGEIAVSYYVMGLMRALI
jgi:putative ABC transport system permease protein